MEMVVPASGTEKSFSPAAWAASAALAASLQGLGMPTLALDSDEAAVEDADAAGVDAADADADEVEAELPLPEAAALLEEAFEQPTTPIASTLANAMASSFLFMTIPFLCL